MCPQRIDLILKYFGATPSANVAELYLFHTKPTEKSTPFVAGINIFPLLNFSFWEKYRRTCKNGPAHILELLSSLLIFRLRPYAKSSYSENTIKKSWFTLWTPTMKLERSCWTFLIKTNKMDGKSVTDPINKLEPQSRLIVVSFEL